ncbi:hypothetical protein [Streptomyces sp. NPDC057677]|uniref:hypothetical protein n=1 Tax=unclassified Streptomyces TaxID=2593676 RepID=UPI0036BD6D08
MNRPRVPARLLARRSTWNDPTADGADIAYPRTPGVSAVPLGDGTWLTHDGGTVQRWTTP